METLFRGGERRVFEEPPFIVNHGGLIDVVLPWVILRETVHGRDPSVGHTWPESLEPAS